MIATWKQALNLCLARAVSKRGRAHSLWTLALAVISVAAGLNLVACGGGGGSTTVKSVAISPDSADVNVSQQADFTAVVTLDNSTTSTTTTVTWEVDGVSGGNSACGTIAPSPTDALEGVYTAPVTVPTSSCGVTGGTLGQVAVTAVATQNTSSTSSGTVTSNTATVTVGVVLGLAVSPSAPPPVPAGNTVQFSALLNGNPTGGVSWNATSTGGGNPGSIDSTGLYVAPPFPPPGNSVTITATAPGSDGGSPVTATAAVTIIYSDDTLSGPYAFSYVGNDGAGFFAVEGSFVADGKGNIISGVEDIQSFLNGASSQVVITASTYSVGSDGRGSALIKTNRGTATWRFVLSTNLHAQLTRFDTNVTGGGSIDQQTLNATTNSSDSVISGRYTFEVLGVDAGFNPLGMAGEFPANGSGSIPNTNAVIDVNDNGISQSGTVTRADASLNGSYSFDSAFPGTGRGTLTLQSTTTGATPRTFVFYAVDTPPLTCSSQTAVCQLYLLENDGIAFTAGNMYLAPSSSGLADANYVFTAGGNSSTGAYASGGVFASDGVSATSNGVLDINDAGTYNKGPALGSCSFAANSNTGRIDLGLYATSGTCPSVSGAGVNEFAAYPTGIGSVVLLELDSSAVAAGLAYQQCGPESAGCNGSPALSAISIGLGLTGQGLFHSPPVSTGSFQPDLDGQLNISSANVNAGNLDINNFSGTFAPDPIGTTGTSVGTPSSNGRGTATLAPTNPSATYNLVYYLIDDQSGLLLSSGQSPVAIGAVARQF